MNTPFRPTGRFTGRSTAQQRELQYAPGSLTREGMCGQRAAMQEIRFAMGAVFALGLSGCDVHIDGTLSADTSTGGETDGCQPGTHLCSCLGEGVCDGNLDCREGFCLNPPDDPGWTTGGPDGATTSGDATGTTGTQDTSTSSDTGAGSNTTGATTGESTSGDAGTDTGGTVPENILQIVVPPKVADVAALTQPIARLRLYLDVGTSEPVDLTFENPEGDTALGSPIGGEPTEDYFHGLNHLSPGPRAGIYDNADAVTVYMPGAPGEPDEGRFVIDISLRSDHDPDTCAAAIAAQELWALTSSAPIQGACLVSYDRYGGTPISFCEADDHVVDVGEIAHIVGEETNPAYGSQTCAPEGE